MRSLVLFGISLFTVASLAGGVDGGGGKALVCRDANDVITRAEMLDLYEGKIMYGTSYIDSATPHKQQLREAFGRLDSGAALAFNFYSDLVQASMRIMPVDTKLLPIDDSLEIIAPRNCAFEQAANFFNDKTILIDGEIWAFFSETQKAALIAHETMYWDARNHDATDSRRSRFYLAHAFDPSFKAEEVLDGVPANAKTCLAGVQNPSGIRAEINFVVYPNPNYPNEQIMQFTSLPGRRVMTKTTYFGGSSAYDFSRADMSFPGDNNIGNTRSSSGNTLTNLDVDYFTLSQEIEPVIDDVTKKEVPGYHLENYYLEGYSQWEPKRVYSRVKIICYSVSPTSIK